MQALLLALLILQVVIEGWRWHMFAAYAATLLIAAASALIGTAAGTLLWAPAASLALLAVSALSCLLLPFVAPEPPHGPFAVGVTALPAGMLHRPHTGPGELQAAPMVRLWYPAQVADARPQFSHLLEARISARLRAEPTTPAAVDAPAATGATRFPVLIYFDGWPEDKIQNVQLILELASRGFMVASAQYPAPLPGMSVLSDQRMRAQLSRPILEYSSDAAFEHSVQLDHSRARAHARDTTAILDALSALDTQAGSRFAQRLDTQHAGALGFSFGGAVAAEASRMEPRIAAVVNMDGRHWGDSLAHGVQRPYMFICEELAMPTAAELASSDPTVRYEAQLDQVDYSQLAVNLQALGGIRVTIAGMAHLNFTDVPLRSPLRRLSEGGSIDPRRAQRIIQTYVIEFFSRYLTWKTPPALDSPLPSFPEVHIQSWAQPQAAQ